MFAIILFAMLTQQVSSQEQQVVPKVKFEVPEKAETDEIESVAKEALGAIALMHSRDSEKSFEMGMSIATSEVDSVKKWTILQLLVSDAVEELRPDHVLQVIGRLDENFDFPSYDLAIKSLIRLEKKQKRPDDRIATIRLLIASARVAIENCDFEAAKLVFSYDSRRLPRDHQKKIQKCLSDLQTASKSRKEFVDRYSNANMLLAQMPDDEKANLFVALYACTLGQSLDDAIGPLSKSGDKELESIARLESGKPSSPDEFKQLADLWWELSNRVPQSCRKWAVQRASSWYEKSLASLTGLDLAVAKKRIAEAMADDLIPMLRLDLLRADLRRSIKNGSMDEKQSRLHLGSSDPGYCQFFQPLSDNYDLEYKFTRDGGKWGFAFIFFERNRPFMWNYSGNVAPNMGFAGFQKPLGPKNASANTIADRQSHTLLLRIRANRFEAILDGNLESDIRNPLDSKPQGFVGHPAELSNVASLSIVDWWGVTTVESATYTEYW